MEPKTVRDLIWVLRQINPEHATYREILVNGAGKKRAKMNWLIFKWLYHDLTLNVIMLCEEFSILPDFIFENQFSNLLIFSVEDFQPKPWSLCTSKALINSFSNIIKCLSYKTKTMTASLTGNRQLLL